MKLNIGPHGYYRVTLYKTGEGTKKGKSYDVHKLVLETFVGPRPLGNHCRHLNGNKHDNRLENLKWGTPRENAEDSHKHGVYQKGSQHHRSKLTEDKVIEIRHKRMKYNTSTVVLATQYDVTPSTINSLLKRDTWKHI